MRKSVITLLMFLFLPIAVFGTENTPVDPNNFYLWNGFEEESGWNTSDWANNAMTGVKYTNDFVTQGKKSMEVAINAKAGQTGMIQTFDTGDMSGVDGINFDIYNSTLSSMQLRLMVKSGKNWQIHESSPVSIKPGWNRNISIPLDKPIFMLDGQGGYKSGLLYRDFIRRFGFEFIPDKPAQGAVYIDNLGIKGSGDFSKLLPQQEEAETVSLKEVVIDDFEKGAVRWSAAADWSCASRVEKVINEGGGYVMKAVYNMKEPGQNAVFALEGSYDLSGVYDLKADIYNPNDFSMNMGMSLGTGDKWVWQEATLVKLEKGWNRNVTIHFKKKTWKNERSGWANNTTPDGITSVKRISLLFYPPDMGEGYALVDNVRMDTTDPDKLETLKAADIGPVAFRIFDSFEKGIDWKTSSDQSGAVALNPVSNYGGENNRGMELVYDVPNSVGKAAYTLNGKFDFSSNAGIKFDLYNPMPFGVKITLAFQYGDDMTWIETKQFSIAPGWNKDIFIDFVTPSFKSALSNWNFTDTFFNRNDIRAIVFSIFTDKKASGSLYMSDIKLARRNYFGGIGDIIGASFVNSSNLTVEPITYQPMAFGSFEGSSSLNYWAAHIESGWGAAQVSISDKFASKGSSSLQVNYKDTGVKFGVQCTLPPTDTDVSGHRYLVFDLYNPNRQMKVSLALQSLSSGWYETPQIVIGPGWNKNIKFDLNAPTWKNAANGWASTDILREKETMKMLFIAFQGGYEGSLYIDNVRWGNKSPLALIDASVEQDVNIEFTPGDNVQGAATLKGVYYHGQNAELNLDSAHMTFRGFGNELTLYGGEPINVFDDVFGIVNTTSVGPNTMGASLAGTIFPTNTSYNLIGLTLWNSDTWQVGSSYLAGARIKQYIMGKNYVGAIGVMERRGYDIGANPLTDDFEEAVYTFGGDGAAYVPVSNIFDLTLKGEALYSYYAYLTPVYLIPGTSGNPAVYAGQTIPDSLNKMLWYFQTDLRWADLMLSGYYRQIDPNFSGTYINTDYKPGLTAKYIKATYTMDNIFPFSYLKQVSDGLAGFVRNTQLMAEADLNTSYVDTYQRATYRLDLKNDQSLAFYNYEIWYKYNYEGNTGIKPAHELAGITKLLLTNDLSINLMGKLKNQTGAYYDAASNTYTTSAYFSATGYIQVSYRLCKELKLTGNYKILGSSPQGIHTNWYAETESIIFNAMSLLCTFGVKPFTGYWLDDNNNDTITRFAVTFKGYF